MEPYHAGASMNIIQGNLFCDVRGYVTFINDLDLSPYKRFYMIRNHNEGFIRAWHGHEHESKAVICLQGAALIGIVSLTEGNPQTTVLTAASPKAVIIPAGHANGAMSLSDDCILMYYSDKTIEEAKLDDLRFPWDHWGYDTWKVEYK